MVESPSRLTGINTLKKAQELRETFMVAEQGNRPWLELYLDIGRVIQQLGDARLEVQVIPHDLLDKLKLNQAMISFLRINK